MEEKDAIELLGKLKSFMEGTNKQIEKLILLTHNQGVEICALKKELSKNRILVAN